jgi:hypothetical protein
MGGVFSLMDEIAILDRLVPFFGGTGRFKTFFLSGVTLSKVKKRTKL